MTTNCGKTPPDTTQAENLRFPLSVSPQCTGLQKRYPSWEDGPAAACQVSRLSEQVGKKFGKFAFLLLLKNLKSLLVHISGSR